MLDAGQDRVDVVFSAAGLTPGTCYCFLGVDAGRLDGNVSVPLQANV